MTVLHTPGESLVYWCARVCIPFTAQVVHMRALCSQAERLNTVAWVVEYNNSSASSVGAYYDTARSARVLVNVG